jgi:hypothetical protein
MLGTGRLQVVRYRDYLTSDKVAQPSDGPDVDIADSAVVAELGDGSFHAVWQGRAGLLGEFDGTREEAVAWARRRSKRCFLYTRAPGDLMPLEAGD